MDRTGQEARAVLLSASPCTAVLPTLSFTTSASVTLRNHLLTCPLPCSPLGKLRPPKDQCHMRIAHRHSARNWIKNGPHWTDCSLPLQCLSLHLHKRRVPSHKPTPLPNGLPGASCKTAQHSNRKRDHAKLPQIHFARENRATQTARSPHGRSRVEEGRATASTTVGAGKTVLPEKPV